MLGNGGQNVDSQPIGLREIDGVKLDTRLHQVRYEGDIAGQPIEFGDNQGRAVQAAETKSFGEPGPITPLAALDFGHFSHQPPINTVEITADSRLLGIQAETTAALALGADTIIGHKLAGTRCARDAAPHSGARRCPVAELAAGVSAVRSNGAILAVMVVILCRLGARKTPDEGTATGAGGRAGGMPDAGYSTRAEDEAPISPMAAL
jgi:hypothetical protein